MMVIQHEHSHESIVDDAFESELESCSPQEVNNERSNDIEFEECSEV